MANLIGGAAVGLIFSQLYKAVENLIKKTKKFRHHFEAIKATLDSLKPVIDQMEKQNKKLKLSNTETEKLKNIISDGIELVGYCSKNPKWYSKPGYTNKLTDLDEALKRQLKILEVQGLRDGKETLLTVKEIKKLVNQQQVLIIFLILVCMFMFSVPGVREQKRATSSASAVFWVFVCVAIVIVCSGGSRNRNRNPSSNHPTKTKGNRKGKNQKSKNPKGKQ